MHRWSFAIPFLLALTLGQIIADRYGPRFDLTARGERTLGEEARAVTERIPDAVEAIAFYLPDDPGASRARDLLERFAAASNRFTYRVVDPDRNPGVAARYGATGYGALVLARGERRVSVLGRTEGSVASAILALLDERRPRVSFVTGHGERSPAGEEGRGYGLAAAGLGREGIDVDERPAGEEPADPGAADLVVLAGPLRAPFPGEAEALEAYVRRGGRVMILLDPEDSDRWNEFLGAFGLLARHDVVVDKAGHLAGGDVQVAVVDAYDLHDATRGLRGASLFPRARSAAILPAPPGVAESRSLLRTGPEAWGETNETLLEEGKAVYDAGEDTPGPLLLGALASVEGEGGRRGRVVLVGDADFASDRFFAWGANADLFTRLAVWLAGERASVGGGAPPREEEPLLLTASTSRRLFAAVVVLLPALFAAAGLAVFLRRRSG